MKLVAGGAWQGKREWVKAQEKKNLTFADGKTDDYEKAKKADVILGFHQYVRRMTEDGQSEEEILSFADSVVKENPHVIITMDEVGYGIVPMDALERRYRENAGRAGQLLASMADEVYRVVAGIGQRIK